MSLWTRARILALCLVLLPYKAAAGGDPPQFILQWGSNGAGQGQFSGPHGIAVDDALGAADHTLSTSTSDPCKPTSPGEARRTAEARCRDDAPGHHPVAAGPSLGADPP